MSFLRAVVLLFALGGWVACASSENTTGDAGGYAAVAEGTVAGLSFANAIPRSTYAEDDLDVGRGPEHAFTLSLSLAPRQPICAAEPADVDEDAGDVDRLQLSISYLGTERRSLVAGDYAVTPPGPGEADATLRTVITALHIRPDCSGDPVKRKRATSGSVRVETLTLDAIVGTFDLDFEGEKLRGSFNAPRCALAKGSALTVCK
ncbi:MAG: hypothetical protein KIT84_43425 [Labilithrix sp.]|nr:hypothetical protein [Labilithrix sp.]MCW5817930.1 hypothetical protein [Labilithrix sp.]